MLTKLIIFLLLSTSACFSQTKTAGDTLVLADYDTIRVELHGKTLNYQLENDKKFPFCSDVFALPQDSFPTSYGNCCKYSTHLYETEKIADHGVVSCIKGYSLMWHYTKDLSEAKASVEDMLKQIEEKSLNFKKETIQCYILNEPTTAYLLNVENANGHKYKEILYAGSYKDYHFTLSYVGTMNYDSEEKIEREIQAVVRMLK